MRTVAAYPGHRCCLAARGLSGHPPRQFLIDTAVAIRNLHRSDLRAIPQALASILQNSNNGSQELKIAVSPQKSITSIFLIAVAAQGKAPQRDSQPSGPLHRESQVANREPQSVIDSPAIRNRRKPFALTKIPDSNRHKSPVFVRRFLRVVKLISRKLRSRDPVWLVQLQLDTRAKSSIIGASEVRKPDKEPCNAKRHSAARFR